jgi:hypothetical protein
MAACTWLGPVDDGGGAQGLQPVGLGRLAGGRDHGEAQPPQQRDGDAADAARGAGHQHLAGAGLHAVVFERQHTEHGGVAGRADGHRLAGREGRRQLDQPVALEPRLFGQAAPVRLAHAPAVVDEGVAGFPGRVAGFEHHAGAVDAGDHGPLPHHRALVGDGQAVLVVERGPVDAHQHVVRWQGRFVE